jgi:DNA-binding winged helix-turn-helix (wHTH) protein
LVPTSSKYRGVVCFDGFELDLASGQLRRDGISLRLQPQPTKVLVELVGRAGEVVSRKELADQVWGSETFVDFEQGLNFAIRQIRTALGDDADQPRFLETLPKRGYRFIRPVEEATPQSEPLPEKPAPSSFRWALVLAAFALLSATAYLWLKRAPATVPPHTTVLAVLPFDDLSAAP